jgi:hypothetical protein
MGEGVARARSLPLRAARETHEREAWEKACGASTIAPAEGGEGGVRAFVVG